MATGKIQQSTVVVEKVYSLPADSAEYWGLRKWSIPYTNDIPKSQIVGYVVTAISGIGAFNSILVKSDEMWLLTSGADSTSSGVITIRFLLKKTS